MSQGKGPLTPRPNPTEVEKSEAKSLGGTRVAASGATPWSKEDIRTDDFLIQHKDASEQKGLRINFEELERGRCHAIDDDKYYAYVILSPNRRWFLIQEDEFNRLAKDISG